MPSSSITMWARYFRKTGLEDRRGLYAYVLASRRTAMGLIKDDRQLAITRRTLAELNEAVRKIRAKYRGPAYRAISSGPLGMIGDLEAEIREYQWLRKATPAKVMR